ncbi:MAG: hypothetical protein JKX95_06675 [Bacteroidia bacterium]|nr:hypothetical protein [Bacteroidia bacterium]
MYRSALGVLAGLVFLISNIFAQDTTSIQTPIDTSSKFKTLPMISSGLGLMTFFGDVANKQTNFDIRDWYHSYKLSYYFQIESKKKIKDMLPMVFSFTKGYLAGNERSMNRNLNFETKLLKFSGFTYYVYNFKKKTSKKPFLAPFISVGLDAVHFSTNADQLNVNGNEYFYWDDGTIRTIGQNDSSALFAVLIQRDYDYETTVIKSRFSFGIPISLGLKLHITDRIDFDLKTSFNYSVTDFYDNLKSKSADKYYFTSFGLRYDLNDVTDKIKEIEHFEKYDILAIDKLDSDGDKVKDFKDRCPDTPADIKTNRYGCPPDKDKDGIPDYFDKEPESQRSAMVDLDGIEITTEQKYSLINLSKENHFIMPNITQGDSLYITNKTTNGKLLVSNLGSGTKIPLSNIANGEELVFNNLSKNEIFIVQNLEATDTLIVSKPGIVFRIELGKYRRAILGTYFRSKGFTDVTGVKNKKGEYIYWAGAFKTYEKAEQEKANVKNNGFRKATIAAFNNGKQISVEKAKKLSCKNC